MRSLLSLPWFLPRSSLLRRADPPVCDGLSAGDLRCLHHHLDHRHFLRQARLERLDHGRSLQGPHRHRPTVDRRPWCCHFAHHRLGIDRFRGRRRHIRRTPLLLRHRRPRRHCADRGDHRILYRHGQASGRLDRPGLGHRSWHQRHPGPSRLTGIDGAAKRSSSSAVFSPPTSSAACSAPVLRSRRCSASPE